MRDPRTMAVELAYNHQAWIRLIASGGLSNFGDELSANVLEVATGHRPKWAPIRSAELIAIGSILDRYLGHGGQGLVWGSGLRGALAADTPTVPPGRVLAVRGRLTASEMMLPASTPLGDPGLIIRAIIRSRVPRRGVVAIPHFSAYGSKSGRSTIARIAGSLSATVVAPSRPPLTVARLIRGADLVVTSSLHGLIVADALGTPAILTSFGPTQENLFKYDDYLSIFDDRATFTHARELTQPRLHRDLVADAEARTRSISPRIDRAIDGLILATKALV